MRQSRRAVSSVLYLLLPLATLGGPVQALAGDAGRLIIDEENDALASNDDRHYTQGLEVLYVSPDVARDSSIDRAFQGMAAATPLFGTDGLRRYSLGVGQSLFTPSDTHLSAPNPRDRPYAGWLYGDFAMMQEQGGRGLETLDLLLGVVGPAALGEVTQNDFHQFIRVGAAEGWHSELHNEPGLVLSYERKWRLGLPIGDAWGIDAVPQGGVSVGNVLTYGAAGGLLRIGRNLSADYGPTQIRPSLSSAGWFDAASLDRSEGGPWGWYAFVSAQERAVARNIFLDGNSFASSPSVDRRVWVDDLVWGVSAYWSDWARLDFSVTDRSREFTTQQFRDRFGVFSISFRL